MSLDSGHGADMLQERLKALGESVSDGEDEDEEEDGDEE